MSKLDHVFASRAVGIDWHSLQLLMPDGHSLAVFAVCKVGVHAWLAQTKRGKV